MLNKLQPDLITLIPDLFTKSPRKPRTEPSYPLFIGATTPLFSSPQTDSDHQELLGTPTRPQFLTHSQMMRMMDDQVTNSGEFSSLKSEDDLCYSRSHCLAKVDEQSEEHLSSVSELESDKSERCLTPVTAHAVKTPFIDNLTLVHSELQQFLDGKTSNLLSIE